MRAAKSSLEATRQEVARLCEGVAGQHAALQLARSQLAQETELLRRVRGGGAKGVTECAPFADYPRAQPHPHTLTHPPQAQDAVGDCAPSSLRLTVSSADGSDAQVEVSTEAEARALLAEQTLAASRHLAAAGAAEARRQASEQAASRLDAETAELTAELARVRAERAAAARSYVTEAQKAQEAAAFYENMHRVLSAVVGPQA